MSKLYKHHVIPKHAGGSDDPSNIKLVTLEQHAEEHRLLWEKYNRKQDYIAWKCLSGQMSKEDLINEIRSMNGFNQGKVNAQSGFMKYIQTLSDTSAAGKISAEVCREKKVNSFFNDDLRKIACSNGGRVQGLVNAQSGHLKRISLLPRKYTPKHWYNNGITNIMVKEGQNVPDGYKKGRLWQTKKN
jgi:hypothetical protein